jgi:hypothetical protein
VALCVGVQAVDRTSSSYSPGMEFPIRQANHQELVPKANFGAIHNQTDLLQRTGLGRDPLPGQRLKPFAHRDGRVVQRAAQTAGQAGQQSAAGGLPAEWLRHSMEMCFKYKSLDQAKIACQMTVLWVPCNTILSRYLIDCTNLPFTFQILSFDDKMKSFESKH